MSRLLLTTMVVLSILGPVAFPTTGSARALEREDLRQLEKQLSVLIAQSKKSKSIRALLVEAHRTVDEAQNDLRRGKTNDALRKEHFVRAAIELASRRLAYEQAQQRQKQILNRRAVAQQNATKLHERLLAAMQEQARIKRQHNDDAK